MFTPKAVGYFTLASFLLVLALLFQDFQLAALVLPVAAIFFVTNVWGFSDKVDVELDREVVPFESFGDEDILVNIQVTNRGRDRLGNVEVEEVLPRHVKLAKGTNILNCSISPGETVGLSFEIENPGRGHYPIGPLNVRIWDSFGLYLTEKRLGPDLLAVMPKPERVRGTEFRPRHLGPWSGVLPSRTSGVGTEFYSLRGYVPGDDLKRINWKASARTNRLIVNELEAERTTDVMVVLDTDVAYYEPSEKELFEQGVKAAASICSLLLRQGNRVGLILQGEERGVVPPAFGKRQERRILYMLASAKPGQAMISTGYVINLLARFMLPARAQMFIISPLLERTITDGIRQLVIAGYSITVLAPQARAPEKYGSEAERLAHRITQLERSNVLLGVEKTCRLIQWQAGSSLSGTLRQARKLRLHA